MNAIINKFLLAADKFMPEIHLHSMLADKCLHNKAFSNLHYDGCRFTSVVKIQLTQGLEFKFLMISN